MPLRHALLRPAHRGHGGEAPRLDLPQLQQLVHAAPLGPRGGRNGRPGGPAVLAGPLPGVGAQGGEGGAAAERRGQVPGRQQPQNVHKKLGRKREEHGFEHGAHKPRTKEGSPGRRRRPSPARCADAGRPAWQAAQAPPAAQRGVGDAQTGRTAPGARSFSNGGAGSPTALQPPRADRPLLSTAPAPPPWCAGAELQSPTGVWGHPDAWRSGIAPPAISAAVPRHAAALLPRGGAAPQGTACKLARAIRALACRMNGKQQTIAATVGRWHAAGTRVHCLGWPAARAAAGSGRRWPSKGNAVAAEAQLG